MDTTVDQQNLPQQYSQQIVVNFVTKNTQFAVASTPFNLDAKSGPNELNKLVKTLIAETNDEIDDNVEFEFLINEKLLRVTLKQFVDNECLNYENQLEIEFVLKEQAPEPFNSLLHDDWVSCVQANQQWIISGCYDNTLHIWSKNKEGKHRIAIPAHSAPVKAVKWIDDSKLENRICTDENEYLFVSGSHDETAIVWKWNSKTNEVHYVFSCRGHCRSVDCIDVHNDLILTGSYDQMLKIWSLNKQQNEAEAEAEAENSQEHSSSRKKFKKNNNEESNKSKINVPIMTLSGHSEAITGCVWMNSIQDEITEIASCSMDNTIRLWDIEVKECKRILKGSKAFLSISYSPLNKYLITGSCDRHIRLWDPRSDEGAIVKTNYTSHHAWVSSIRWSLTNENQFISGGYDNVVKQWDLRSTNAPLYDLLGHQDKILCVDWSSPELIISGGADNQIKIYSNKAN